MDTPKAFGSIGIVYLEQAVLLAIGNETLKGSVISTRIGLYDLHHGSRATHFILKNLERKGYIEQLGKGGPWKRTDIDNEQMEDEV